MGISKIARDISERIEMEQEIRAQIKQREGFLAMLSHELRNPLNAVSSATAILSDERAPEEMKIASSNTIQRQVGMINHLLADLLDVARIAEDRISLNIDLLDLRDLIPDVKEIVHPQLEKHHCSATFNKPDKPVLVQGDRTRLIQILVNLIHNAAKYSETKKPIRVSMECREEQVHLLVADDGKGIPPEMLESIFEPFAQLEQSLNKSDGGLGVGLTLAKSLVELHHGTILAKSEGEGGGCEFHIWLPACREKNSSQQSNSTNNKAMHSTISAQYLNHSGLSEQQIKPLYICIVEDMDDSRNMIQSLLELDGHRVETTTTGKDAVELLIADPPDFALIDIGLPDISGYEVARQVREQEADNRMKLIALTGFGQKSDVRKALEAGFDDHIVKPLSPELLKELCTSIEFHDAN